jgi:hypothetical protein
MIGVLGRMIEADCLGKTAQHRAKVTKALSA